MEAEEKTLVSGGDKLSFLTVCVQGLRVVGPKMDVVHVKGQPWKRGRISQKGREGG